MFCSPLSKWLKSLAGAVQVLYSDFTAVHVQVEIVQLLYSNFTREALQRKLYRGDPSRRAAVQQVYSAAD